MVPLYLLFIISIFTTVGAHLCFKKGMLKLGEISFSFPEMLSVLWQIVQNAWILLGAFLFVISFFTWLFIISKVQLSVAYPIVFSIEVTLVTLASLFLFKEYLSLFQIFGIIFIIMGIILLLSKI